MGLKKLYDGRVISAGPFSKEEFWNIMEYLLIQNVLEDEHPYLHANEIITKSKGIVRCEYTWHIKNKVKVNYVFDAENSWSESASGICVSITGPGRKAAEVASKIHETIEQEHHKQPAPKLFLSTLLSN